MARTETNASKSKSPLVIAGFLSARRALHLQQKWIIDHVIAEIASDMVKLDEKLTRIELNSAVSKYFKKKVDLLHLHNSNNYGIYKLRNEKRINGKRQRVTYYFFTKDINKIPILPNSYTRIYQTRESIKRTTIMTRHTSKVVAKVKENILSRPSKRKKIILESEIVPELEPGLESDEERKRQVS